MKTALLVLTLLALNLWGIAHATDANQKAVEAQATTTTEEAEDLKALQETENSVEEVAKDAKNEVEKS